MRNSFEEALHFRHACKAFDGGRKIPVEELRYILEATRLSPSSFGIEGWKFLVIQDGELKSKLSKTCWNPNKLEDCSDVVVLLNQKNLRSSHPLVEKKLGSNKIYADFIDHRSDEELTCWSAKQAYIASAFLMMSAASIKIDSCPIEGFRKDEAIEVLEIDTNNFDIAYIVALGYRVNEQPEKIRRDFDAVVEFR